MPHVKIVYDADKAMMSNDGEEGKAAPRRRHICFIDDSRTSTYVTRKMLTSQGFEVTHFAEAEAALDALMEQDFDLLLTDLVISAGNGMNGDDFIRVVRHMGHPQKSQLPILVVTGANDKQVHNDLLAAGANGVLLKPLQAEELGQVINDVLRVRDDGPSAGEAEEAPPEDTLTAPQGESAMPTETPAVEEGGEIPGDGIPVLEDRVARPARRGPKDASSKTRPAEAEQSPLAEFERVAPQRDLPPRPSWETPVSVSKRSEQRPRPVAENTPAPAPRATKAMRIDMDHDIASVRRPPPVTPPLEPEQPAAPAAAMDQNQPKKDESIDFTSLVDDEFSRKAGKGAGSAIEGPPDAVFRWDESRDANIGLTRPAGQEPPAAAPVTEPPPAAGAPREPEKPAAAPAPSSQILEKPPREERPAEEASRPVETTRVEAPSAQAAPTKPAEARVEVPEPHQTTAQKEDNPLLALLEHLDENKPAARSAAPSLDSRKLGVAALFLALVMLGGFFMMRQGSVPEVEVVAVEVGSIHETIAVPGTVVSRKRLNLTSYFPGQLVEVSVKEGDRVKQGAVLGRLDAREAKSKVNRAEANLMSVQEEVAVSSKNMERLQKALDLGAVSRQMVEDAEATWKSASARQAVAEEELQAARLVVERLEIKAPFDGVVTALHAQSGQWLAPPEPLLTLIDINQREIELRVDAADAGLLRQGQKVLIASDAAGGKSWQEQIRRIAPAASRDASANLLDVHVSFSDSAPDLRMGQQVDAQIRVASSESALRVPFGVVQQRNNQSMVATVREGRIRFVPVTTGLEDFSHIEIVHGLQAGEVVVFPGGRVLEEGQRVSTRARPL